MTQQTTLIEDVMHPVPQTCLVLLANATAWLFNLDHISKLVAVAAAIALLAVQITTLRIKRAELRALERELEK